MDLAKSTYYYKISKEDIITKRNEEVLNQIIDIFKTNKELYSVRRFHHELINCGYSINHKRVQKLMHKAGLFGKWPKEKYHSYIVKVSKIANNVINRDFNTTAPLQKQITDITQFNFSLILDVHTNEIISYGLSLRLNLDQIKRVLNNAYSKFSSLKGLILH